MTNLVKLGHKLVIDIEVGNVIESTQARYIRPTQIDVKSIPKKNVTLQGRHQDDQQYNDCK